jgi:hypothetical protein
MIVSDPESGNSGRAWMSVPTIIEQKVPLGSCRVKSQ